MLRKTASLLRRVTFITGMTLAVNGEAALANCECFVNSTDTNEWNSWGSEYANYATCAGSGGSCCCYSDKICYDWAGRAVSNMKECGAPTNHKSNDKKQNGSKRMPKNRHNK